MCYLVFQQVWRWNQQTCSCREWVCAPEEGVNTSRWCFIFFFQSRHFMPPVLTHNFVSRMLMLPTWTRWSWRPKPMLFRMRSTSSGLSMKLYVIFIVSFELVIIQSLYKTVKKQMDLNVVTTNFGSVGASWAAGPDQGHLRHRGDGQQP